MIIGLVNKISPVVPCKISAVVPSRSIANKKRSVAVKKVKISKKNSWRKRQTLGNLTLQQQKLRSGQKLRWS